MTVAENEAKFTESARFALHMVDTDYKKARKSEGDLRNDILEKVNVLKLSTYIDLLDQTLMLETNMANQSRPPTDCKRKRQGFFSKKESLKKWNTGSSSTSSSTKDTTPTCNQYGKKHYGVCYRISVVSFKCGKMGHMARDCTQTKQQRSGKPGASSAGSILIPGNTTRPTTTKDTIRTTHSFVSTAFASRLNRPLESLPYLLCVSAPSRKSVLCTFVYCFCDMHIGSVTLYVDLLPLDIRHFNVILGMDWLAKYYATIDYVTKQVIFRPPGHNEFIFVDNGEVRPPYLISIMKAYKLLRKGYQGYLCSVMIEQSIHVEQDSIPIFREFPDVFPDGLLGELVDRDIEFTIDIVSGTQPISKTPYRMSTIEMK
ncbi:uncharacterized protein LOC114299103 [Camellia sinensis]|uniref:uncharacterized protein LOC114299103 n=1 Tax=Camellia sinensis TaxID=4442 RepID=UPI001036C931|nr:uncharacterized protein LOC114299103 [Camellia sinensis]